MSKPVTLGFGFATQTGPIPLSQLDSDFGSLAAAINDFGTYGSYFQDSSGTANLITINTPTGTTFSYAQGLTLNVMPANTNTGAVQINVNGLGNKSVTTAAAATLAAGAITAYSLMTIVYDGTVFRMAGGSGSGLTNTTFSTVVTAGSGLAGSYASPQFLIETAQYGMGVDASGNVFFKNTNNGTFNFYNHVGATQPTLSMNDIGMNIQSSAGGAALTVGGTAGYNAAVIDAAPVTNQSYGLQINAGTSASDHALAVNNATGATNFFNINGSGATTFTPTAGYGINVSGVAGTTAALIQSPNTSNQSQGLFIVAGTTANDYGLRVVNAANNVQFLEVYGNGGVVVGGALGGTLGVGTLNASGLYVNGVSVGTSSGGVTSITAGTGITVSASTGAVTITASGAGVSSAAAGTGISVSASTGAVTFSNTGVTSAAAGTGISVSASTGGVTFTNSGVTSLAGTASEITVSASTGGVTISLPSTVNLGASSSFTSTAITIGTIQIYGNIPQSSSTTAALTDRNCCIIATGTITVPNSTFNAGDTFSIYNNSGSAITISAGVTTMRLAGTTTTGSRTLAARGMATVWFVSGTECVVNGAGVT